MRPERVRPAGLTVGTQPRWLSASGFWIGDDGRTLEALAPSTGRGLSADGAVREAILARAAGSPYPAWLERAADALEVGSAMATASARPLTRADVLRGGGYGMLFVELTARCNERCTHCYADASPERDDALAWDDIVSVLDDARALEFGTVQFTGGDPLLHADLVRAATHARAIGIPRIEIFTNGLSLSDALLDRLAPLGVAFAFSVYSAEADEHDAVTRVPGSHARTLRAIRRCLDRGLRARVGVTLTREDHDDGAAVRASLRALGLDDAAIRITTSRSVGRGRSHGHELPGAHGEVLGGADGKACVASDGTIHPCIFARGIALGSLRTARLRAVLEDAAPIVAPLALGAHLEAARLRLSCGECRLRDALLAGPTAAPERLVTLRRLDA